MNKMKTTCALNASPFHGLWFILFYILTTTLVNAFLSKEHLIHAPKYHFQSPTVASSNRPKCSTWITAPPPTTKSVSLQGSHVDSSEYDLSLFSPCKINLFLRILRKRPDNYHDLASLFQTVGFGDTLHLKLLSEEDDSDIEEDVFECNMKGVPTDKTNLVIRALDLMREKTGNTDKFFKVNLDKKVPAQAGLGGGSGNAATAMYGANELFGRPATLEQLIEWSGDLGSDITFFLSRGSAYCTGRGEIMTPINPPPFPNGIKLCIVKPSLGLSTPTVFKALDYDALSTVDPEQILDQFCNEGVLVDSEYYINDLEPPAFQVLPELMELKKQLVAVKGFERVMMSGSGTSIFCIGEVEDKGAFMKTFGERDDLIVVETEFISRGENEWFQPLE